MDASLAKAFVIFVLSLTGDPSALESSGYTVTDLKCMADNIYHEGRGEPIRGQYAIAHVVVNREEDDNHSDSICEVIKFNVRNVCAFSWFCDSNNNEVQLRTNGYPNYVNIKSYERAIIISYHVLTGSSVEPCERSTHYYNYNIVNPTWAPYLDETCIIGNHRFMKTR